MRIIATALLALSVLALPATSADAHRRYYHSYHHYYGPSEVVAPGFLGLFMGPSYGYYPDYYYGDPYWGGGGYGGYRHWHTHWHGHGHGYGGGRGHQWHHHHR